MQAPPSPSSRSSYFPSLTGLRGVAALLVFFHHVAQIQAFPSWFRPLSQGYLGVSVFFTLSGFLITRVYFESLQRREIGLGEYFKRRFARIYPLFFFLLTFKLILDPSATKDFWAIVVDYSLAQGYFGQYRWTGLAPAWSMSLEESFYLLAPLVYWVLRRRQDSVNNAWRTAGILTLWGVGLWYVGKILPYLELPFYFMGNQSQVIMYGIFGRFAEFGVGVFAGLHFRAKERTTAPRIRWLPNLAFVAGLGVIGAGLYFLVWQETLHQVAWGIMAPEGHLGNWIAAAGTTAIIWACLQQASWANFLLGNRIVEFLGRISFAFYLLQDHFYFYIFRDWVSFAHESLRESMVGNYLVMTVVAALLHLWIEQPAHRWLTRNSKIRNRSGGTPPPFRKTPSEPSLAA